MHSDSHRFSWRGGEDESCRGCSTHLSHPEPENPARAVAHFHGATRSFTASGNDARRSVVDFGKTFKAAARSANDTFAASGPRRRSQFFTGIKCDATNFRATVCKSGGGRRGQ